jgi:4'-phosphopantetheinyl transferase
MTEVPDCARLPRAALAHSRSDVIDVWVFRLDVPDWRDRLARGSLSDDERGRAERYAFEEPRRRFVVCRTTVRAILGAYLGEAPHAVALCRGPHGKPRVDASFRAGPPVHFNVSHSGDLALLAVCAEREVGIDLEGVRPLDGMDEIVERHFTPAERLALGRVPPVARLSAFYRYWTLKEAYLKACGVGLEGEPAQIDVTRAARRPIRLPERPGAGHVRWWQGLALELRDGYRGALVVEVRRGVPDVRVLGWPRGRPPTRGTGSPAGAPPPGRCELAEPRHA